MEVRYGCGPILPLLGRVYGDGLGSVEPVLSGMFPHTFRTVGDVPTIRHSACHGQLEMQPDMIIQGPVVLGGIRIVDNIRNLHSLDGLSPDRGLTTPLYFSHGGRAHYIIQSYVLVPTVIRDACSLSSPPRHAPEHCILCSGP